MNYLENDTEILFTTAIRAIKHKPGAGNIYIPPEIFQKFGLPVDVPMNVRFDKEKKEICIKLITY